MHFDAADGRASGSTAFYQNTANAESILFAKALANTTATVLGIPFRGAKPESESQRGKLALTHKLGTTALLEICFIDNAYDMACYDTKFTSLAKTIARLLEHFARE